MLVLDARTLSKAYATNRKALQGLSFTLETGDITGVVGPNGSGKTTLINCVLGLLPPSGGEIVWGQGVVGDTFLIPDKILLPELLTGREYLDFLCKLYDRKPRGYTPSLITVFEMDSDMDRPIAEYSFGMKKKVQVIAACAIHPSLLVLDEPFRGLDVESVVVSKAILKHYAAEGGSVLLSSHDVFLVEQLCSSVMMLYSGDLKACGSPEDLMREFSSESLEGVFVQLGGRDIEKDVAEVFSH